MAAARKVPRIARDTVPWWQEQGPLAEWQTAGKGGHHCAFADKATIEAMFLTHTRSRIGCAIEPGVIVIDLDDGTLSQHHPDLLRELEALDTFVVRTARGWHFYVRTDALITQTNSKSLSTLPESDIRRCVDVKVGGDGFTILPPSKPYEHFSGDITALAELPDAWVDVLSTRQSGTASAHDTGAAALAHSAHTGRFTIPDVSEGKLSKGTARHPRLHLYASQLRGAGLELAQIAVLLHAANESWFADPKPRYKIDELAHDTVDRYPAGEQAVEATTPAVKEDALAVRLGHIRAGVESLGFELAVSKVTGHALGKRSGGSWLRIRKGCDLTEELLLPLNALPAVHMEAREEFRCILAVCRMRVVDSTGFDEEDTTVREWGRDQVWQLYTIGVAWESSGLRATTPGVNTCPVPVSKRIKAALDLDGWKYRDIRWGAKHGERLINPHYERAGDYPGKALAKKDALASRVIRMPGSGG